MSHAQHPPEESTEPTNENHNTATRMDNPEKIGIEPGSEIAEAIELLDHDNAVSIHERIQSYNDDDDNNIFIGRTEKQALAAYEVMQKSLAVLVEMEPWFVKKHMSSDEYERWEPFVLAFPEIGQSNYIKFTNMAPLSAVTHQLVDLRDEHLENHRNGLTSPDDQFPYFTKSIIEEYTALTRYQMDSCYNGEDDPNCSKNRAAHTGEDDPIFSATFGKEVINGVHNLRTTWADHLIIGQTDDGTLYADRGQQFDDFVNIAIDVARYQANNEHKLAVYNDKSNVDAIKSIPFEQAHPKYLPGKGRWEIDNGALGDVIETLLEHETIDVVSVNRATERIHKALVNPEFGENYENYPGF